ncbi:MAG: cytochrome C oxidase subunit IV family protein [Pirellulales bacterium]
MSEKIVPPKTYYLVFGALLVLLMLTVAAAEIPNAALATTAAVTIAVTKALLIILFFMHVRYSSGVTMVFAAGGFLWLAIMFAFTTSDYLTRGERPFEHEQPPVTATTDTQGEMQP